MHSLDWTDGQTRHHELQVAQEVEKGSETDARVYSAPYDYPFVENPWADFINPAEVPLKAEPDKLEARKRLRMIWAKRIWRQEMATARVGEWKPNLLCTHSPDNLSSATPPTIYPTARLPMVKLPCERLISSSMECVSWRGT